MRLMSDGRERTNTDIYNGLGKTVSDRQVIQAVKSLLKSKRLKNVSGRRVPASYQVGGRQ